MIKFGPMEISFIINVLILLLYFLDDGKSILRYIAILITYVLSLFLVLGNGSNEVYNVACLVYLFFLSKKLFKFSAPYTRLLNDNKLNSFERHLCKRAVNVWNTSLKRRNGMHLAYCLSFMFGVITINYF